MVRIFRIFPFFEVLFPFNFYRLVEIRRLIKQVSLCAWGDLFVDWLKSFMRKLKMQSSGVLFSRGEKVDHLYFLVAGGIRLREVNKHMKPEQLFGRIAFFISRGRENAHRRMRR